MLTAIKNVLRIQFGGLFYLALPCNSFTWMCWSQHQRSVDLPFGNEADYEFVRSGNRIAYRSSLLIILAIVRRVTWMLENPGGSRCIYLPVIQRLLQFKLLGSMQMRWWGSQLICRFEWLKQICFLVGAIVLKLTYMHSLNFSHSKQHCYTGVSKNRCVPKSSILFWLSILGYPYFWHPYSVNAIADYMWLVVIVAWCCI